MALIALTLALLAPYGILTLMGRLNGALRLDAHTRMKVGVSLVFFITGSTHFTDAAAMAEMLPPIVPSRVEIIYVTGVLELLGAIGIWVPRVSKLTGACLILMLIGVLPANIYSALSYVPFGGHDLGPLYLLVRIPFQVLLIGWIYVATRQTLFTGGPAVVHSIPE